MKDAIVFFGGLIATVIAVFGLVFWLAFGLVSYSCRAHEEATGQPTKMVFGTCYVKEDGRWMHWDEYKLRFATKGAN